MIYLTFLLALGIALALRGTWLHCRNIMAAEERRRVHKLWLRLGGRGRKQMEAALHEVPELASWRNVLREWRARDAD